MALPPRPVVDTGLQPRFAGHDGTQDDAGRRHLCHRGRARPRTAASDPGSKRESDVDHRPSKKLASSPARTGLPKHGGLKDFSHWAQHAPSTPHAWQDRDLPSYAREDDDGEEEEVEVEDDDDEEDRAMAARALGEDDDDAGDAGETGLLGPRRAISRIRSVFPAFTQCGRAQVIAGTFHTDRYDPSQGLKKSIPAVVSIWAASMDTSTIVVDETMQTRMRLA